MVKLKPNTHKSGTALLQRVVLSLLKTKLIKFALKKILGSAVAGGFKAMIIKFLVKEIIFDEMVVPTVQLIFRELGYQYRKIEGKHDIKKLKDATNATDYNNAVDDAIGG